MPAITITAVNTGTEEITAVGHGLLTGDRFRLRNVGGALPAATPALAGATDYFAIRTGADTLKISDTNAHALAGTGIFDLTGAGSGTNTVEYGLPYCLPTAAAAAGTQIKSANDNLAWAALVAIYCLLTGLTQTIWSAVTIAVATTFTQLVTFAAGAVAAANQHFTVSGTGLFKHGLKTIKVPINGPRTGSGPGITGDIFTMTGATQAAVFLIPWLPNGTRILGAKVRLKDNATGPTTMNFTICPSVDGTEQSALGTSATSAGSGATQTLSITGLTSGVAALTSYYVRVQTIAGSALQTIYAIEVDFDQN